MTVLSTVLDADAIATVVDSLADKAEGFSNGAYATDDTDTRDDLFSIADDFELLGDKVAAGFNLSGVDLSMIVEALESSEENAADLGLDDAATEYADVASVIRSL